MIAPRTLEWAQEEGSKGGRDGRKRADMLTDVYGRLRLSEEG